MRVLIGCPVKDRAWILPTYLQSVLDLIYPKDKISLYWIVNNSSDASFLMLSSFKEQFDHVYEKITIEVCNDPNVPKDIRRRDIRRDHTYNWLPKLRNKLLDKCIELDCDYLLSCDCDILMKDETLQRLLDHKEHCVSSLVYNGYLHRPTGFPASYSPIENAYLFPNCLNWDEEKQIYIHIRSRCIREPQDNPIGKTIVAHFTGACILISKELCGKSRYAYFNRGEDEPFCRGARERGYNVLCDVSMFNAHIMSESLLQLYQNGLLPKVK
jgi:hypothetical protein